MSSFDLIKARGKRIINRSKVNWIKRARWVQDGKYVTASGVSVGIDAAFYIISELVDLKVAKKAFKFIEYIWRRNVDEDLFADMYP
ncbi:hypothetical protein BGZ50_006779 [Haplosporangium sp. Z 11]|nr:hypothetical protein BGZ50_006779 [Haplosporangium sp. Z 11]